jgi:type VI secretion system protein ImpK
VGELLNAQDSQEGADALELHVLCLLLGYRGKYALGDSGEIANIIRHSKAKIARTRGELLLIRPQPEQPVAIAQRGDPWVKRLVIATAAIAVLTLVAYLGYTFLLAGSLSNVQTAALMIPAQGIQALLRGGSVL